MKKLIPFLFLLTACDEGTQTPSANNNNNEPTLSLNEIMTPIEDDLMIECLDIGERTAEIRYNVCLANYTPEICYENQVHIQLQLIETNFQNKLDNRYASLNSCWGSFGQVYELFDSLCYYWYVEGITNDKAKCANRHFAGIQF